MKMIMKRWLLVSLTLVMCASARSVTAQERNLYWGDTHLHTSYSIDAYNWGNASAGPGTAYRFAKGLPVAHPTLRNRVRLDRPLDFLVVTDHSGGSFGRGAPIEGQSNTPAFRQAGWSLYVDAAERHYDPGTFTTFVGWEWTSMTPENLHRVVFTPADGETAKRFLPASPASSGARPEDLWNWLEMTSDRLGIDFVAIPHNSNLSLGLMFDMVDSEGRPISAEYARTRMRWEPVVEVLQIKGASETHPLLSPIDEFANFEIYEILLRSGVRDADPAAGSYARTGLLRGLDIEDRVGVNPYKFGLQAATDSHTSLSTPDEDNFWGKTVLDSSPEGGATPTPSPFGGNWDMVGWDYAAQGLTGAWASENTREALTEAFKRKEVYATSGPRIQLRMFGGFEFDAEDANARDIAAVGYGGGVSMGGDLGQAPNDRRVSLLIHAVKDPVGANLDRVQVIKGWLDEDGDTNERVYDVEWAGDRRRDPNGRVPAIGSTVDVEGLTYDNAIGSAELSTVWVDPGFDPDERAFYYVRVLEIPTLRHSTYDAVALGQDPAEATARPSVIQERALSSPIWYTP